MQLHPSFPVDNIFQIKIEPVTVNNILMPAPTEMLPTNSNTHFLAE